MEWLAHAFAWIAAMLLKSWFSTAIIGLAKLLFSLFPKREQQEFQDLFMPDIPTPPKSSNQEPSQ